MPRLCSVNAPVDTVNTVPTLSDTKRRFYAKHNRPISSIYRRFLEELMVEMHLLSVNNGFAYDAIYALGVVTTFDRFMEGYEPQTDQTSIFESLCLAINSSPNQYRQDATTLMESCQALTLDALLGGLQQEIEAPSTALLLPIFKTIAQNHSFKYSRLFAIGFLRLLEQAESELIQDKAKLETVLDSLAEALALPAEKMKKDAEMYLSSLDKMGQARLLMEEMVQTERKRREQREQDKKDQTSDSPDADAASEDCSAPETEDASTPE